MKTPGIRALKKTYMVRTGRNIKVVRLYAATWPQPAKRGASMRTRPCKLTQPFRCYQRLAFSAQCLREIARSETGLRELLFSNAISPVDA